MNKATNTFNTLCFIIQENKVTNFGFIIQNNEIIDFDIEIEDSIDDQI